jgi:hypothetical protein
MDARDQSGQEFFNFLYRTHLDQSPFGWLWIGFVLIREIRVKEVSPSVCICDANSCPRPEKSDKAF